MAETEKISGTGGSGNTAPESITGGSAPESPKRRTSARGGSTWNLLPGRRNMKSYPLTKRDMQDLLAAGKESNRFYAFGGVCAGACATTIKELSQGSITIDAQSAWKLISFGLAALAAGAFWFGYKKQDEGRIRLQEIEEQTIHDGQ
jgi:hypothetical protein